MVNVVIDGYYIMHKTFGIFTGYEKEVDPSKVLSKKSDQSVFIRKVITDLFYSLRSIPIDGRIIFTADSRSWRKEIEIENGGYKSKRNKNENVDWSVFFNLLVSLGNHLESKGFIFSKVEGAEGDDLLLFWSREFNKKNENCIVISGDNDIHQLARIKENSWTIIWNNNSKKNILTVPENWEIKKEKKEEISVFNLGGLFNSENKKLIEFTEKLNLNRVVNLEFIFNKILMGDEGDSVPSVWEVQEGNKVKRFTEKKAKTVYEHFLNTEWNVLDFNSLASNDSFLSWVSSMVLKISKDVDSTENRIRVKNNYIRNCKLMWLDPEVIPERIINGCNSEIERGMNIKRIPLILDRIKFLEGSDWADTNYTPDSLDPFKNFKK
jgi:5'-3' exonuclease